MFIEPLESRRLLAAGAVTPILYRVRAENDAGASAWSNVAEFDLVDGDADLDGVVGTADYFAIDRGFLNRLSGWDNGDFDGDGAVGTADYFIIDYSFLNPPSAAPSEPQRPAPSRLLLAEVGLEGFIQ